jgi:hypothetical protein
LLAIPTIITMVLSGLWHGAGYLFLLWGLLHGVYLVINHAWRRFARRQWKDQSRYASTIRLPAWALTFLSVVFAMVLFRSTTLTSAGEILGGMVGLNGITLPSELLERSGLVDVLSPMLVADATSTTEFVMTAVWLSALLVIALFFPNTREVMERYEPVLRDALGGVEKTTASRLPRWSPSLPWLSAIAILAAVAVWRLGGPSEFLYWQF